VGTLLKKIQFGITGWHFHQVKDGYSSDVHENRPLVISRHIEDGTFVFAQMTINKIMMKRPLNVIIIGIFNIISHPKVIICPFFEFGTILVIFHLFEFSKKLILVPCSLNLKLSICQCLITNSQGFLFHILSIPHKEITMFEYGHYWWGLGYFPTTRSDHPPMACVS
jgi:hypothetical protein